MRVVLQRIRCLTFGLMKNKKAVYIPVLLTSLAVLFLFPACFKDLPHKYTVYFNDFESNTQNGLKVYNNRGLVDSNTIIAFNGGKVFGRFNNNRIELHLDNLPEHNAIKITFDLYIHDKWDGDYLIPGGNNIPDVWQMTVDNYPFYLTTFSNGAYGQSFPNNYQSGAKSNPARGNAWDVNLPGICALKDSANGTSLYKIELTTSHTSSSFTLACNDALQPFNSICLKSWSIDNLTITTAKL